MHKYLVELGGFQPWMWSYSGDRNVNHLQYTQQPDHWSLFFLEHDGIISVNNKPIPYSKGNVAFVVPGTKVEFLHIGTGTWAHELTFGLVPRSETVVIPAVADLGDLVEIRRQEFQASHDWLQRSIMRGLACAFNVLWSIAEPPGEFRKSDLVYRAEAMIVKNLHHPIAIGELSKELGLSHTHLLRLFRDEHHCTIQQFIRDKRAELGRQMICDSQLSLKEVAVKVGCPDLQYFNKLIRSTTGLSPSKLREQARNRTRH